MKVIVMKHCCIKMEGVLEECDSPLRYIPYTRSYDMEYGSSFQNTETGDKICVAESLIYCPWCATKLPKDLMDEWTEIVQNEFNVKDTLDKKELKKIPEEYMSEEWWEKRGL